MGLVGWITATPVSIPDFAEAVHSLCRWIAPKSPAVTRPRPCVIRMPSAITGTRARGGGSRRQLHGLKRLPVARFHQMDKSNQRCDQWIALIGQNLDFDLNLATGL
jgi:hypothetical protein